MTASVDWQIDKPGAIDHNFCVKYQIQKKLWATF